MKVESGPGGVVWKYPLQLDAWSVATVRHNPGKILTVDVDPEGIVCAWALVDPDQPAGDETTIAVVGTGQALPLLPKDEGCWTYLSTFKLGAFVFHAWVAFMGPWDDES